MKVKNDMIKNGVCQCLRCQRKRVEQKEIHKIVEALKWGKRKGGKI